MYFYNSGLNKNLNSFTYVFVNICCQISLMSNFMKKKKTPLVFRALGFQNYGLEIVNLYFLFGPRLSPRFPLEVVRSFT